MQRWHESVLQEVFPGIVCHKASSVAAALALVELHTFDLGLIDLGLPDGSGVAVVRALRQKRPESSSIVVTIFDDNEHLFPALKAGAQGYLLKDQSTDWLARQLQGMAEGQLPLSPAVARRLLRHFRQPPAATGDDLAELSPREREVLGLLAQGVHIADIGKALAISRHTVGDHVKSIYRKLNISSRAEAALRARSMGLI